MLYLQPHQNWIPCVICGNEVVHIHSPTVIPSLAICKKCANIITTHIVMPKTPPREDSSTITTTATTTTKPITKWDTKKVGEYYECTEIVDMIVPVNENGVFCKISSKLLKEIQENPLNQRFIRADGSFMFQLKENITERGNKEPYIVMIDPNT